MKKSDKLKKSAITILFLFILLLVFVDLPEAQVDNVLYVGSNQDYIRIQDAINNVTNGDTIFVYSGIYHENIVIDKSINLVGEDKKSTIIDGNNVGDVVLINIASCQVNITGFTIQNSGNDLYNSGLDIDTDRVVLYDNIIQYCLVGVDMDLWCHNCTLSNNIFRNNYYGLKVYSVFPNFNLIYDNNFYDNNINAFDNSNSTYFFEREGNFWDDYTGTDSNDDGIGDTVYNIPGGAVDEYPLMNPVEAPGFEFLALLLASLLIYLFCKIRKK